MLKKIGFLSLVVTLVVNCTSSTSLVSNKPLIEKSPRMVFYDEDGTFSLPVIVVEAGGKSFNIPVPDDFQDMKSASPVEYEELENEIGDAERLLVTLVENSRFNADLDEEEPFLTAYMMLSVKRKIEYKVINDDFYDLMRPLLKKRLESPAENMNTFFHSILEEASEDYDKSVKFEIVGGPYFLGIFHEMHDVFSVMYTVDSTFDLLDTLELKDDSTKFSFLLIRSVVRVSNRFLNIDVIATYKNEDDIEWFKQLTEDWISAIFIAN